MATAPRVRTPAAPSAGGLGYGLQVLGEGLRRRKERKEKEEEDLLRTSALNEFSAVRLELGRACAGFAWAGTCALASRLLRRTGLETGGTGIGVPQAAGRF